MRASSASLLCLLVCGVAAAAAGPFRVLGMFPLAAHSHNIFFTAMMELLAERGHEVVMFSPFPHKRPLANYTDVDTSGGAPSSINSFSFDKVSSAAKLIPGQALFESMTRIGGLSGAGLCRKVFSMPEFDKLMRGGYGRFDVVFTEVFGSDCWAAVAHKMRVPLVSMSSAPDVPWMHERLGSPDNPAYLNTNFGGYTGAMTLWQRLVNTCTALYVNLLHKMILQDPSDAVVREFLGEDMPPITDMVRNTSLVLLNRHVGVHPARPVTPNVVHVGGLHIKPAAAGALDPELLAWMDSAEHGVVFFSLGSMMRSDSLPAATRDALLAAFSRLPQRVIWKFETPDIKLPDNVRIGRWVPQMAILSHPKTVLFMTHAGLMGSMEALHSSVPMLCIPLFGDQHTNSELYHSLGVAERLDLRSATEDTILAVLRQLTEDPSYRRRAREVSALFRDRPRLAADEAVWWAEYVVRHRGAPHLRPLGADMPLHEYLLLDVAALAAGLALAALALVVLALRKAVAAVVAVAGGKHRPETAARKKRE